MNLMDNIVVVIPSLNPDEKMINTVKNIYQGTSYKIIIVNDGSGVEYDKYFNEAKETYNATILKHNVNQGKGRALKTAFNYVLNECPECRGVITVDADGQHSVEDTIRCAEKLLENEEKLVMGCRDFRKENIPFRSRFGNIATCKVMDALCGIKISDTQTGLRGISRGNMSKFLKVKGEKFEYEMNMLIESKNSRIEICEVPIKTIYIDENESSHFNPLMDSLSIYSIFAKFILSSLSSFIIDIVMFTILINLFRVIVPMYYILIATLGARVISSIFNYSINKNKVFQVNDDNKKKTVIRYFTVCLVQLLLSAYGVKYIFNLIPGDETLIKIIVDSILFIISFQIQREWVFSKNINTKGTVECHL